MICVKPSIVKKINVTMQVFVRLFLGQVLAYIGKCSNWLIVSSVVAQGPGEIHSSMQLVVI